MGIGIKNMLLVDRLSHNTSDRMKLFRGGIDVKIEFISETLVFLSMEKWCLLSSEEIWNIHITGRKNSKIMMAVSVSLFFLLSRR